MRHDYRYVLGNNGKNTYETPTLTGLSVNNKGYIHIGVAWRGQTLTGDLHRIACIEPNPECKPTVNHKDGNKWNNHYSNLEWNTYKENQRHANTTGLNNHVKPVVNNRGEWFESTVTAAKAYGIDRKTVYNECMGLHKSRAGLDWRWADAS